MFRTDAASWSQIRRLAGGVALVASTGLLCAQAPDSPTTDRRASAIPTDLPIDVSSPPIPFSRTAVANHAASVPSAVTARADIGNGIGPGLSLTQFPAPAADYFQSYRGFGGSGTGFVGAGRLAGKFNRFGGASQARIAGTAGFGFEGRGLRSSTAPNFSQMMRASAALPFGSSVGGVRSTHRDALIPGVNETGQGTSGINFSTTSLGNGVFFSAGTNVGRGSMAGTPPGGNAGANGPKPSRPAVALKLSF